MDISSALTALEQLSSSTSTSSSGPLNSLIDTHFTRAKQRILAGEDAKVVITDLQKSVVKSKKDVEKGLKGWYGALGNVGKAVDKSFPPNLGAISKAYEDPPLFSEAEAAKALDRVVLDSLGRQGLWDAVAAMEEEASLMYDPAKRALSAELTNITLSLLSHDLSPALAWCGTHSAFLSSPPHPSVLPYHLHRAVFRSLSNSAEALAYARKHMMVYVPTQPVLKLITECLYDPSTSGGVKPTNGSKDEDMEVDGDDSERERINREEASKASEEDTEYLISLFQAEFCRLHQWAKEDPLEVVVDLGSRGGALNVVEKARRVMGDHLGHVRTWQELPMQVPLPASRRYHSVFVCPVSKEQATETNPPKMLTCGHVIAEESFNRLLKAGRRSIKCPYCPVETSQTASQRLYF